MLTKKYSQHFQKMLMKKILTTKILLIKNKKVKTRGYLWDLNLLSGLFWASWALQFASLSTFGRYIGAPGSSRLVVGRKAEAA
jgi:hypothetical protein